MNKKKKHTPKKVSTLFRSYSVGITLIVGLVFLLTFSIFQIKNFNKNAKTTKEHFFENSKRIVKDEVYKVLNYIYITRSNLGEKMGDRIKSRVEQAWSINNNIYEKYKNTLSEEEIKILIKSVLRPVRFFSGRGYYFIDTEEGINELYPPFPEYEETNILNLQDTKGSYVVQDEIKTIKEYGEGFVTGYWKKPGDTNGIAYPKTSYIKHFAPLNWHIGAGEYLDNFEKELQEDIIKKVQEIRFGKDGSIFINTYDNKVVLTNLPDKKPGDDLSGMTDLNGVDIISKQKELALQDDGGFYEYRCIQPETNEESSMISYVKGIDEWGWIIGAEIHTDEIEVLITENEKALYKELSYEILLSTLIFLFVLVLVFITAGKISRKISTNFYLFTKNLKKAVWDGKLLKRKDYSISDIELVVDDINKIVKSKTNAERLLIESETRTRTILEYVPVMIFFFDKNFYYLNSNKEVLKYFDLSIAEENKATLRDILKANNFDTKTTNRFITLDGSFNELEINTVIGSKIQNWAFLQTETKEIIGVGYDITEIKENQQKLKELNETKDKFFSIISHDLIGPFNTIVGLSDLLLSDYNSYDDRKKKNIIKQIYGSSTSMYKMLANLLNWASTQTGTIEYTPIDFKLKEIVDEVVNILNPQATEKSITIINNIRDDDWVVADPMMTNTVIQNLIANSVKFTNKGGEINIYSQIMKNEFLISISDNGIGIKREIIDSIFTINKEKKQKGTANESGTGLGLVICKEFVEKMGGKIWVESQLGKGTTFFFTLKNNKAKI